MDRKGKDEGEEEEVFNSYGSLENGHLLRLQEVWITYRLQEFTISQHVLPIT